MSWFLDENNLPKISGLTAIIGAAIILIADIKLCYMPLPPGEYSIFRAAMTRSPEIILFYSKLAIFGCLLVIPGLSHFSLTLRRTNKVLAWTAVAFYVFAYCNAAIYYAYLAYVMNTAKIISPINVHLPFFTKHMFGTFQIQYYYAIGLGSILLFISLIFFSNNNYPKWYVWINPVYLLVLFRLFLPIGTPPKYAGFFMTASFNLSILVTLIMSTLLSWKKPLSEIIPDFNSADLK